VQRLRRCAFRFTKQWLPSGLRVWLDGSKCACARPFKRRPGLRPYRFGSLRFRVCRCGSWVDLSVETRHCRLNDDRAILFPYTDDLVLDVANAVKELRHHAGDFRSPLSRKRASGRDYAISDEEFSEFLTSLGGRLLAVVFLIWLVVSAINVSMNLTRAGTAAAFVEMWVAQSPGDHLESPRADFSCLATQSARTRTNESQTHGRNWWTSIRFSPPGTVAINWATPRCRRA